MKKIYKKLLFVAILLYVTFTLVNQQKTLNSYKKEQENYEKQISEKKEENTSLASMQENVNSPEYIEKIAREKLDMYLPNEKKYVDIGK